jgi:DNA (cytosine-5)-methyltransferase 1
MKILNLYSGIGGNRRLWGDSHEITAVEYDQEIADVYADLYPKDKLIVTDAHEYLKNHYAEYDFIWSSPPCQTHSSFRQNMCVRYKGTKPEYANMQLYQQIIFLKYNFKGYWIVENVRPYYEYLIEPTCTLQRHPFWSSFEIPIKDFEKDKIRSAQIPDLQKLHKVDLSKYKLSNKRQVLRNCVLSAIGEHIIKQIL